MSDTVLINIPLYEPVIAGNPFYIWVIMILGAALVFALLIFYKEVYEPMQPVWGFRTAAKKSDAKSTQAIIRTMNGKIWLEPLDFIANVFESLNLPLRWIITVPVSGQMGKVNTIDVSDDWNVVHNLDIDYAIVEAAHRWTEKYPNDPLYDWNSFQTKLMDGSLDAMFPQGIKLPPFRVVDMHEIRRYRPKWHAAHHSGFINAKVEERKGDEEKKGQTLIKYFAIGAVLIIIASAIGYVMLTGMKCPVCA